MLQPQSNFGVLFVIVEVFKPIRGYCKSPFAIRSLSSDNTEYREQSSMPRAGYTSLRSQCVGGLNPPSFLASLLLGLVEF